MDCLRGTKKHDRDRHTITIRPNFEDQKNFKFFSLSFYNFFKFSRNLTPIGKLNLARRD